MDDTSRDRALDGQPFDLRVEPEGGITFVRLTGEMDMDCEAPLRAVFAQLADEGASVRVDLRGVTFMDSGGLRLLIKHQLQARQDGFDLALIAPTGRVKKLLDLVGAERIFTISEGAAAAQRASAGMGTDESTPADFLFGESLNISRLPRQ